METCPWCRGDTHAHCKTGHPTCSWVKCDDCHVTIDPDELRAYDKTGTFLEWPHAKPKASE